MDAPLIYAGLTLLAFAASCGFAAVCAIRDLTAKSRVRRRLRGG